MSKAKRTDKNISNCCNAEMFVDGDLVEGTNFYRCKTCGEPCDMKPFDPECHCTPKSYYDDCPKHGSKTGEPVACECSLGVRGKNCLDYHVKAVEQLKCPKGHALEFYNTDTKETERVEECIYCNTAPLDVDNKPIFRFEFSFNNNEICITPKDNGSLVYYSDHEAAMKDLKESYEVEKERAEVYINMANKLESALKAKEEELVKYASDELQANMRSADFGTTILELESQLKDKDARILELEDKCVLLRTASGRDAEVKALQAEIKELKNKVCSDSIIEAFEAEQVKLRAEIKIKTEALESVWIICENGEEESCPYCKHFKSDGHNRTCFVYKALAQGEGK
jgi:transcription initiation factor TFIIIB Brf1 subunit/transcription initiation factor TFIIB